MQTTMALVSCVVVTMLVPARSACAQPDDPTPRVHAVAPPTAARLRSSPRRPRLTIERLRQEPRLVGLAPPDVGSARFAFYDHGAAVAPLEGALQPQRRCSRSRRALFGAIVGGAVMAMLIAPAAETYGGRIVVTYAAGGAGVGGLIGLASCT
jgi:hypothetical protein